MPLVWVTGNSGAGKSAVCALLEERGELAVDADGEGYHQWVDRTSGQVVTDPPDPPDPVPAGELAAALGENAGAEAAYRRRPDALGRGPADVLTRAVMPARSRVMPAGSRESPLRTPGRGRPPGRSRSPRAGGRPRPPRP
jgi:hypothetical protein